MSQSRSKKEFGKTMKDRRLEQAVETLKAPPTQAQQSLDQFMSDEKYYESDEKYLIRPPRHRIGVTRWENK